MARVRQSPAEYKRIGMSDPKCKICRRANQKLFLKGERCFSPKCAMVRRPYRPGAHGQSRKRRSVSEFGKALLEKQKLQHTYHLSDNKMRRYVKEAIAKKGEALRRGRDVGDLLIEALESRLDSIVFRLGFAASRSAARHLVSHGHFLINSRRIDIPSAALKIGDTITLRTRSKTIVPFKNVAQEIKNHAPPSWLSVDPETLTGRMIGQPQKQEAGLPADLSLVIEYYSR